VTDVQVISFTSNSPDPLFLVSRLSPVTAGKFGGGVHHRAVYADSLRIVNRFACPVANTAASVCNVTTGTAPGPERLPDAVRIRKTCRRRITCFSTAIYQVITYKREAGGRTPMTQQSGCASFPS
jgi:hypothetical protein